jgi:hypothetical protein
MQYYGSIRSLRSLGRTGRVVYGALGGMAPFAVQMMKTGHIEASHEVLGTNVLAVIVCGAFLGALVSAAAESHHPLLAVYHGAGAPTLLAFMAR